MDQRGEPGVIRFRGWAAGSPAALVLVSFSSDFFCAHMKAINHLLLLATLALVAASATPAEARSEALTGTMNRLARDTRALTAGIFHGDFPGIEQAAWAIADHPNPPLSARFELMARLGSRLRRFKALDEGLVAAARAVAVAARAREMDAVLRGSQKLVGYCVACHRISRGTDAVSEVHADGAS